MRNLFLDHSKSTFDFNGGQELLARVTFGFICDHGAWFGSVHVIVYPLIQGVNFGLFFEKVFQTARRYCPVRNAGLVSQPFQRFDWSLHSRDCEKSGQIGCVCRNYNKCEKPPKRAQNSPGYAKRCRVAALMQ